MKFEKSLVIGATLVVSLVSAQAQYSSGSVINGNGDTGFGGSVGNGNLVLTDNGTDLTVTLNSASALGENDLVLYLDTFAGGFSSTAGFMDDADGGRAAVSGYDGAGQQSVLTFAAGFTPDFAIDIGNTYASLYGLIAGGANSLDYITGATQSGAAPYSLTIPLSDLGVIEGSGDSFQMFGTLISETAYRSTEAIAGTDTGVQGYNPFTDLTYSTYTTMAAPEPTTLALGAVSGLAMLIARRRR
jgi:hypothetical protein